MFKKPFNLPLLFGFGPLMTYAFLGAGPGKKGAACNAPKAAAGGV
jgi:hypothetical protein